MAVSWIISKGYSKLVFTKINLLFLFFIFLLDGKNTRLIFGSLRTKYKFGKISGKNKVIEMVTNFGLVTR